MRGKEEMCEKSGMRLEKKGWQKWSDSTSRPEYGGIECDNVVCDMAFDTFVVSGWCGEGSREKSSLG